MRSLARKDTSRSHASDPRPDAVRFCTHCGAVQDAEPRRVCGRCGMGVVLTTAPEAIGKAFLIVTLDLRVTAASAAIESVLGDPDEIVGLPLLALLTGGDELARAVGRAALGSRRIARLAVAAKIGERRLAARVAWCGQPPAALVTLD